MGTESPRATWILGVFSYISIYLITLYIIPIVSPSSINRIKYIDGDARGKPEDSNARNTREVKDYEDSAETLILSDGNQLSPYGERKKGSSKRKQREVYSKPRFRNKISRVEHNLEESSSKIHGIKTSKNQNNYAPHTSPLPPTPPPKPGSEEFEENYDTASKVSEEVPLVEYHAPSEKRSENQRDIEESQDNQKKSEGIIESQKKGEESAEHMWPENEIRSEEFKENYKTGSKAPEEVPSAEYDSLSEERQANQREIEESHDNQKKSEGAEESLKIGEESVKHMWPEKNISQKVFNFKDETTSIEIKIRQYKYPRPRSHSREQHAGKISKITANATDLGRGIYKQHRNKPANRTRKVSSSPSSKPNKGNPRLQSQRNGFKINVAKGSPVLNVTPQNVSTKKSSTNVRDIVSTESSKALTSKTAETKYAKPGNAHNSSSRPHINAKFAENKILHGEDKVKSRISPKKENIRFTLPPLSNSESLQNLKIPNTQKLEFPVLSNSPKPYPLQPRTEFFPPGFVKKQTGKGSSSSLQRHNLPRNKTQPPPLWSRADLDTPTMAHPLLKGEVQKLPPQPILQKQVLNTSLSGSIKQKPVSFKIQMPRRLLSEFEAAISNKKVGLVQPNPKQKPKSGFKATKKSKQISINSMFGGQSGQRSIGAQSSEDHFVAHNPIPQPPKIFTPLPRKDFTIPKQSLSRSSLLQMLRSPNSETARDLENFEKIINDHGSPKHRVHLKQDASNATNKPFAIISAKPESEEQLTANTRTSNGSQVTMNKTGFKKNKLAGSLGRSMGGSFDNDLLKPKATAEKASKKRPSSVINDYKPWNPLQATIKSSHRSALFIDNKNGSHHDFLHDPVVRHKGSNNDQTVGAENRIDYDDEILDTDFQALSRSVNEAIGHGSKPSSNNGTSVLSKPSNPNSTEIVQNNTFHNTTIKPELPPIVVPISANLSLSPINISETKPLFTEIELIELPQSIPWPTPSTSDTQTTTILPLFIKTTSPDITKPLGPATILGGCNSSASQNSSSTPRAGTTSPPMQSTGNVPLSTAIPLAKCVDSTHTPSLSVPTTPLPMLKSEHSEDIIEIIVQPVGIYPTSLSPSNVTESDFMKINTSRLIPKNLLERNKSLTEDQIGNERQEQSKDYSELGHSNLSVHTNAHQAMANIVSEGAIPSSEEMSGERLINGNSSPPPITTGANTNSEEDLSTPFKNNQRPPLRKISTGNTSEVPRKDHSSNANTKKDEPSPIARDRNNSTDKQTLKSNISSSSPESIKPTIIPTTSKPETDKSTQTSLAKPTKEKLDVSEVTEGMSEVGTDKPRYSGKDNKNANVITSNPETGKPNQTPLVKSTEGPPKVVTDEPSGSAGKEGAKPNVKIADSGTGMLVQLSSAKPTKPNKSQTVVNNTANKGSAKEDSTGKYLASTSTPSGTKQTEHMNSTDAVKASPFDGGNGPNLNKLNAETSTISTKNSIDSQKDFAVSKVNVQTKNGNSSVQDKGSLAEDGTPQNDISKKPILPSDATLGKKDSDTSVIAPLVNLPLTDSNSTGTISKNPIENSTTTHSNKPGVTSTESNRNPHNSYENTTTDRSSAVLNSSNPNSSSEKPTYNPNNNNSTNYPATSTTIKSPIATISAKPSMKPANGEPIEQNQAIPTESPVIEAPPSAVSFENQTVLPDPINNATADNLKLESKIPKIEATTSTLTTLSPSKNTSSSRPLQTSNDIPPAISSTTKLLPATPPASATTKPSVITSAVNATSTTISLFVDSNLTSTTTEAISAATNRNIQLPHFIELEMMAANSIVAKTNNIPNPRNVNPTNITNPTSATTSTNTRKSYFEDLPRTPEQPVLPFPLRAKDKVKKQEFHSLPYIPSILE